MAGLFCIGGRLKTERNQRIIYNTFLRRLSPIPDLIWLESKTRNGF